MSTTENRLHRETSPYLLQHKDNPVHWWAWGPDALAEAKRTGKPILLSVGYAACHWCHVMAHESFEDAETAAVMNELYVNIKVDREERPDIDAIYMASLLRFSDQAGWPLTMFLDSDARPFWGGTYFPKGPRWGRPAFVDVLKQIANAHRTQPERVRDKADSILKGLVKPAAPAAPAAAFGESQVLALLATLTRAVDPVHGGLSGAPKFPQWNVFWLLWRGAIRFRDEAAKQAVITTLTHICQGGIYDHLGGGFARYSVDKAWLVPHFEKMLYDNALLIQLLTEVWRETHDPLFAARISETVAWLAREMIAEDGGFAASLDADSEGEEGKFYLWTEDEIASVLGAEDAAVFAAVYGVSKNGNFEGHTILNRLDSMALLTDAEEDRLAHFRARLLAHRATRVRPGWDDKVLADWNGLMIAALARAAQVFARPEWLAMAERAFACVSERMALPNGRLWHSFRAGQAKAPATAADYANMIWGALQLYQATVRAPYLTAAKSWTQSLDRHYWDGARGGYRTTADDTADVIIQLRPAHDDAVPSPNAVQLSNVLALAALTGDAAYATRAGDLYAAYQADIATSPTGHCGLLAASLDLEDLTQIVLVSGNPVDDAALRKSLYNLSVPGALEFCCVGNSQETLPMALRGKTATDGKSRAYVCEGTECGLPVFDTDTLKRRLEEARASNTAQR